MSNLENWKKNGMKGRKPKLRIHHSKMPCFYKGNMFKADEAGNTCQIKLRSNGDWAFFSFRLKKTDMEYIRRHYDLEDASAPTLERAGRGYALRFAFEKKYVLEEEVHRICAVDLGMNSDAVLLVMDAEGTVSARKFISCAEEKDRLHALLDRIGKQQASGNRKNKKLWAFAQHMNEEICRKTVIETVRFAREHGCGCIVMEHLDFSKKRKGSRKQKFHHWRHRFIVQKMEYKAHLNSMRFSTVNAWNTSRLAFDGSGKVVRGKEIRNKKIPKVYGLCEFTNGKIYNCDLNASYNIGARYFIRQKTEKLSDSEKITIGAKVPQMKTRASQTLDTLRQLNAVLQYA
jgi:IS605 OrfB family transposase